MSYLINGKLLNEFGFTTGWVNGKAEAFALTGQFDLPQRKGKTFHQWTDGIEPYVDEFDISFLPRKMQLSLTCLSSNHDELRMKTETLHSELRTSFMLTHDTIGAKKILLQSSVVNSFDCGWGSVKLVMEELQPLVFSDLNKVPSKAVLQGIDGYSWSELGLNVEGILNRYDVSQFQPLKLTIEHHDKGFRKETFININATLQSDDYSQFISHIKLLQSIIGGAGLRRVRYFDGSAYDCFAADGFSISNVIRFPNGEHWANFKCKMIIVK